MADSKVITYSQGDERLVHPPKLSLSKVLQNYTSHD